MNIYIYRPIVVAFALFYAIASQATTIHYDATNIAGNTWQYDYTVSNDSLVADLEEFTIYFDLGVFENLSLASAPAGWDPLAIQPDPLLPDDGFYDALALTTGIASGDQLSGFSVRFDYLGTGAPGSQFFEVIDPVSFNVLDSGFTTMAAVPLPLSLWLFVSGLVQFGALQWNRSRAKS